jgi:transcriptional regulator with XRE-family HTH domain
MSDPALSRLGERLRNLRRKQGLSQEKLADLANLHRTYVGGVERGERNISLLNLVALARALEVSLSELVEGVGSRDASPPGYLGAPTPDG